MMMTKHYNNLHVSEEVNLKFSNCYIYYVQIVMWRMLFQ